MPNLLVVAHDIGSLDVWRPVGVLWKTSGLGEVSFVDVRLARGGSWRDLLPHFDVLGIAPSSFERAEECRAVVEALRLKKRIVLLSDTPYNVARLPENLRHMIDLTFVVLPGEVSRVEALGYRRVVHAIPPTWGSSIGTLQRAMSLRGSSLELPTITGGTVVVTEEGLTCELGRGSAEPLGGDEFLIYLSGTKDLDLDARLADAVRHVGVVSYDLHRSFHVGRSPEELLSVSARLNRLLNDCRILVPAGHLRERVMQSADACLFTGGSTGAVFAAYARLPSVYYVDDDVVRRNLAHGMPDGKWFVAECGGAISVYGGAELLRGLDDLMMSTRRLEDLREAQREAFPGLSEEELNSTPRIMECIKTLL